MAVLLIAIVIGAGLIVVLAGIALFAVAWLLAMALRLCVVNVLRRYRQHQQCAAVRDDLARTHRRAAASVIRLEAAAAQARTDMAHLAHGR